ncbi:MAG: ATP synthase F1 subunit epsilon [Candidatus Lloydbacteria bacterium CG22_combo_CG10-13_8_21_14_all_47_15]|uniref:ATP synthase epsilon chain n=1 Tax=Candidatus Lloydbacteria bacterium CG22_combo_CG10-13_8_21_14_all_47_15 TaxID=1974635 RepID=A0A2H0CUN9_9BACT|nr:MAG: ATP synthase F1 subunit epsilon [Candidatus Lloydbacteria bacterium CG22_combo_CG10-13_8_21_14_all_47_15]
MKLFTFKVLTPERIVLEDDIESATFPTADGEITVLADHIPYIAPLMAGEMLVKKSDGSEAAFAIAGGFVEFSNNVLSVLADTVERAEEIDIVRAEQARKRAEELMRERERMDEEEFARTAAVLERELARVKVAKKYRVYTHH